MHFRSFTILLRSIPMFLGLSPLSNFYPISAVRFSFPPSFQSQDTAEHITQPLLRLLKTMGHMKPASSLRMNGASVGRRAGGEIETVLRVDNFTFLLERCIRVVSLDASVPGSGWGMRGGEYVGGWMEGKKRGWISRFDKCSDRWEHTRAHGKRANHCK